MLQTAKSPPVAAREPDSAAEFYTDLVRFIRRQLPLILGIAFLSLALGVVYVLNAPPMYTAQASMIIDTRKVNLFQQPSLIGDTQVDSAAVESQVEILRSENIALAVIRDLRLADDPEFVGPGGGLIGSLINAAKSHEVPEHYCACRWSESALCRHLKVDYRDLRETLFRSYRVEVLNPNNGRKVLVVPVDTGPARWTRRALDLDKGTLDRLGLKTDDEVLFTLRRRDK